ncbi:hypothetical protein [Bdellovibrio sp. HCB-162]|uniref:hypothetical protein n=1 Tax=Bdellovibrio sp. HCB-162 TaxID=3394234 RepID=UPI0039BD3116
MKRYIKILISTTVLISACAPKVEERRFDAPTTSFGPRSADADVSSGLKTFDASPAQLSWQASVPTAVYFQQAENLVALGKLTHNEALTNKGLQWIKNFYQQPQTTNYVDLAQSPFAALAAAQTQEEVQKTLNEVSTELERSRKVLRENILALGKSYLWPQKPESLASVLHHAETFTSIVLDNLNNMDLPQMISEGVHDELIAQTQPLFKEVRALLAELDKTKTLTQSLNLVENGISKFEVELTPELSQSLKQGRQIAQGLDAISDEPQTGLTVLVDIWRILTPEEQALYFKPVNDDLYDFLTKQDAKELDCLRRDGCSGGIFKGIAKKLFILPKIKKYGLDQLRAQMNEKTRGYVIEQIQAFAQTFATEIPQTFADKIDAGLVSKAGELLSVQKNYADYIKTLLAKWGQKVLPTFKGQVSGFEVSTVKVDISAKNKMSLQGVGTLTDLKANTAGTSMMANTLLLEHSSPAEALSLQSALSQVNKLISIGGYRDDQNKLIPALLSPVEHEKKPLDLMNLTASLISYRIPDKIRMQDAFHADEKMVYDKNFSAASYAEQIKGLSHMLRLTADWKESSFDHILGKIKAQELTEEIQSEALNRSLFPKDMLFALNIGDVAVLLQDITKKATPVFLLTLNNDVLWADQYSTSAETAIMAGIVDIKDGRKSNVVQSQDVARFLLSIGDFLSATEGVENTKSSILLEKDAQGLAPLDALLEGRRDLKLLVVALANFISNQLMTKKSLLQAHYYLNEKERSNNPEFLVEEQIYGIRALLKAWEITKLDAYLWSAQEIYFAMNKELYNSKERFYINGDGSKLDFPQKVNALLALMELKPHLPKASQVQLEKISTPWLKALEELQ